MYYEYLVENFGPQTKAASMEKSALSRDLILRAIEAMKGAGLGRMLNRTNGKLKGGAGGRSVTPFGKATGELTPTDNLSYLNLAKDSLVHPQAIAHIGRAKTSPSLRNFAFDNAVGRLENGGPSHETSALGQALMSFK